jgi:hypothetical protein
LLAAVGLFFVVRYRSLSRFAKVSCIALLLALGALLLSGSDGNSPLWPTALAQPDSLRYTYTDAHGYYEFLDVEKGLWAVCAGDTSSSGYYGGSGVETVNIQSDSQTVKMPDLTLPLAFCEFGSSVQGVQDTGPVSQRIWESLRQSAAWGQIVQYARASDSKVVEEDAVHVRYIGADFTTVVVPIESVGSNGEELRYFVAYLDGQGNMWASTVLSLSLAKDASQVDEGEFPLPRSLAILTPDGHLVSRAIFDDKGFVEAMSGDFSIPELGYPSYWACVASEMVTAWPRLPWWLRAICKISCSSCLRGALPQISCPACIGCVAGYIAGVLCRCRNWQALDLK